jgi:integrase
MDRLHHRDLQRALSRRLQAVAGATVNKERSTLLSFGKWAVREDYLQSSPAAALPVVRTDRDRPPFRTRAEIEGIIEREEIDDEEIPGIWECLYLTQAEIAEILALVREQAEHDFVHPMFAVIAYTGIRRGEMLRLRWLDVDFDRKVITARSRKQSRQRRETSREVDLHPELEAILRELRKRRPKGQYVICPSKTLSPLSKHQANHHFRQPLRGTRWEREMPSGQKKVVIGFHTFRHSFASNLAVKGVDQRIIDRWMGHTTEEMRRRYQHLFPKELAESIRALSFEG